MCLRSTPLVRGARSRLEKTENTPTAVTVCPAMPSVTARSRAMGVSRLTGINSAAMRLVTPANRENTAAQCGASVEKMAVCAFMRFCLGGKRFQGVSMGSRARVEWMLLPSEANAEEVRVRAMTQNNAVRKDLNMIDSLGDYVVLSGVTSSFP